jgi:ABC-2 type transport system permease protein
MNINLQRIRLILGKEWMEIRQQKMLLLGMFFLPVLFTVLPLALLVGLAYLPARELQDLKPMLEATGLNSPLRGLAETEVAQALLGQPLSSLYFLLPVILPSVISSYSVVGEKTNHTLEPLLATPVTTLELLLAKILTALIPAIGITWFFGLIFIAGVRVLTMSERVFEAIISPAWLILFLLCAPLLALITIAVTVAVSSRATDPRSAQESSSVVILPVIAVLIGQFSGLLVLSPLFSLAAALVLALIATIAIWFATRRFQRETILTRWT